MSSKSTNYCFASRSKNVGLVLLCEVALGKCKELLAADINADKLPKGMHSVVGQGRVAPDPASNHTMWVQLHCQGLLRCIWIREVFLQVFWLPHGRSLPSTTPNWICPSVKQSLPVMRLLSLVLGLPLYYKSLLLKHFKWSVEYAFQGIVLTSFLNLNCYNGSYDDLVYVDMTCSSGFTTLIIYIYFVPNQGSATAQLVLNIALSWTFFVLKGNKLLHLQQ